MQRIATKRVVPAAIIDRIEDALPLAEAMLAGGLDIVEVTFRTAAAGPAIASIARRFPEMLVGAGTVLSIEQLEQAIDFGSRFAVAPGFNPELAARAGALKHPFMPGVATATEIDAAIRANLKLLKFFPAEALGGIKMLKALAGPFAHTGVKFLPTGGIDQLNAAEYLALPIVAAVGGSWMVAPKLIRDQNWAEITRLCKDAINFKTPTCRLKPVGA